MLTAKNLITMLVDVVSKNGNLLLDFGPCPNGTISSLQLEPVLTLGHWLELNGEAIYDTRPFVQSDAQTVEGADVRFTKHKHQPLLYITVLDSLAPFFAKKKSVTLSTPILGVSIVPQGKVEAVMGKFSIPNLKWKVKTLNQRQEITFEMESPMDLDFLSPELKQASDFAFSFRYPIDTDQH